MKTQNDTTAPRILKAAHEAWLRMADIRRRRRRYVRYTYGNQWSDMVRRRDGTLTSERELMTVGGREPLSNNLIRRMIKAVVGRYRMEREGSAGHTSGTPLDRWRTFNRLDELDARTMEEFLISGMAIHRVWKERRPAGDGIWVDAVPPDMFFVNAVRDPRGTDMELVGRLIDMSLSEVLMRFARGSRERAARLRELYGSLSHGSDDAAFADETEPCFFHASGDRCRVLEVWTLECRESLLCHDPLDATFRIVPLTREADINRENQRRRRYRLPQIAVKWEAATAWHCRMMAPDGTILDEFDSPLEGGAHPFAVKLYPLIDGDVHSLVEDVIDQQRYVNRLITLMDRMMGTAAKGVLLFPTGCKAEGQKWQEVAEMWADPGGVIPYRPWQGAEPHQVVTPMADFGARDMLRTQIEMMEDVSGVSQALLGKSVNGVVGVERYESEVRNASVAVNDLLRSFGEFTAMRDKLIGCHI